MPSTRWERAVTSLRAATPWRRLAPDRVVRRHVQGVDLYMPWSHLLPDYAKAKPVYGQNLVELAAALQSGMEPGLGPLTLLDVGANIGDSTAQILARTDARALCVEADPYWIKFLHMNVDGDERVTVEESLLTPTSDDEQSARPVRKGGTTRFEATTESAVPAVSTRELRRRHPEFDRLRLVKSDTDGFEPVLVPAIAETWRDVGPVLFFEFDPSLISLTGHRDVNDIWARLAELGYSRLAIWDNGGDPLGQLDITDAAEQAKVLTRGSHELGYTFWDVAARRADDEAAEAAFDRLVPLAFALDGVGR